MKREGLELLSPRVKSAESDLLILSISAPHLLATRHEVRAHWTRFPALIKLPATQMQGCLCSWFIEIHLPTS